MTGEAFAAMLEDLRRDEGLRSGHFTRRELREKHADAKYLGCCCCVLDRIGPSTDNHDVPWHIADFWNDAINSRGVGPHDARIRDERDAQHGTHSRHWNVCCRNREGQFEASRSVSAQFQQFLAVPQLVAGSRFLPKAAFVLPLNRSNPWLVSVVERSIANACAFATSASRVAVLQLIELRLRLRLLADAAVAEIKQRQSITRRHVPILQS